MVLKVYIAPSFRGEDRGDGGMRRVIDAMARWLPEYGWEVTPNLDEADVANLHGTALIKEVVNSDLPIIGSSHGLYWTGPYEWDRWAHHANKNVLEICRIADEVTAPSDWVANTLRRNLYKPVHTVWHGIEPEDWPERGESAGYVLWNKARIDPVSDPAPLDRITEQMPDVSFVTTFGQPRDNVQIVNTQGEKDTGAVSYDQARAMTMAAGAYLATTRETFGIGTLEAMAAGVPIVGWAWGGQAEFVKQNETGILVPEGNYAALEEAIRYVLANGDRLGKAARELALEEFAWQDRVKPYAEIFERALDRPWRKDDGRRVSIIIPVKDGAETITATIDSVAAEMGERDELLIGINPSTDDTVAIVQKAIEAHPLPAVETFEWPEDVHLSGNRNQLIARAKGRYILPLDADDQLQPGAVERLVAPLEENRRLDVTFAGVEFQETDGKRWYSGWPVDRFSIRDQVAGRNQIPYASMYRRDLAVWRGGYRKRCRTAEDADFWIRCFSFGASVQRVEGDAILYANMRPGSLSATSDRRSWWDWYPWSRDDQAFPFGASIYSTQEWIPKIWPHDQPRISIVIPVGPGHEEAVLTAVDSVLAQSFRNWELIVVSDTAHVIPYLPPWIRQLSTPEPGSGVAAARNVGVDAARASWICFLDADDYLVPSALAEMAAATERLPGDAPGFVYPDFVAEFGDGRKEAKQLDDWSQGRMLAQAVHGITALYPRRAFLGEDRVRFDEDLPGWEDWDLGFQLADQGWCAYHLARPLFVYRMELGQRREENYAGREINKAAIRAKWTKYIDGGAQMPCAKCGGRVPGAARQPARDRRGGAPLTAEAVAEPQLWIEYIGQSETNLTWKPPRSGHAYRFGRPTPEGWILAADGDYFRQRPADFIVRKERPDVEQVAADVMLQADAPLNAPTVDAPLDTTPKVETSEFLLRPELEAKSVDDLRDLARAYGVAPARMRKSDLADAILAGQQRAKDEDEIQAGMVSERAAAWNGGETDRFETRVPEQS